MLGKQNSSKKYKDESEAHILQLMKEFAIKLTSDQLHAFVSYQLKKDEVILMQRNAADGVLTQSFIRTLIYRIAAEVKQKFSINAESRL